MLLSSKQGPWKLLKRKSSTLSYQAFAALLSTVYCGLHKCTLFITSILLTPSSRWGNWGLDKWLAPHYKLRVKPFDSRAHALLPPIPSRPVDKRQKMADFRLRAHEESRKQVYLELKHPIKTQCCRESGNTCVSWKPSMQGRKMGCYPNGKACHKLGDGGMTQWNEKPQRAPLFHAAINFGWCFKQLLCGNH